MSQPTDDARNFSSDMSPSGAADSEVPSDARSDVHSDVHSDVITERGSVAGPLVLLALLAAVVTAWNLLIRRFGEGDVYAVIGPYACAVAVLMLALRPRAFMAWLAPHAKPVLIGLGVGVAMTALTYPVFHLANYVFPQLDENVRNLYIGARSTTLIKAFLWILAAATAEELLFRGVMPDVLSRLVPERMAFAISLIVYALAQTGTGSWIVGLMALVCGAIWTVQRYLTGSLLSSLIAHLIWTPTVILFYPVT